MTIIGQLLLFCLFLFCLMIEDFDFVLMYYVETSQLICGVNHLSGFYLVHGIERNIVIFTGLLCLYFIGSFLSVLFLYLTCYSISAQGCAHLFLFKDAG